jgi:hypothetical protein
MIMDMESNYYLYIDEYGNAIKVSPSQTEGTLTDLQTGVEGFIDVTTGQIGDLRVDVVVNDEGLYREDFGTNYVATYLCGQRIVGPVVITMATPEGATIPLTAEQITLFEKDGLLVKPERMTMEEAVAVRRGSAESSTLMKI